MERNVFMWQNLLICNPLNQNNISKSKSRVHVILCTRCFSHFRLPPQSFFFFFTSNFPRSLWGSITLVRTPWSRDSSAISRDTADARGNLTLSGLDTEGRGNDAPKAAVLSKGHRCDGEKSTYWAGRLFTSRGPTRVPCCRRGVATSERSAALNGKYQQSEPLFCGNSSQLPPSNRRSAR